MAIPGLLEKYALLRGIGQRGHVSIALGFCTDPWAPEYPLDVWTPFEGGEDRIDASQYPPYGGTRWSSVGFPTGDGGGVPLLVCEHVYGVRLLEVGDAELAEQHRVRGVAQEDDFSRPLPLGLGLFILRRVIAALVEAHRPPARPGVALGGIMLGWDGKVVLGAPPGWPLVGLESRLPGEVGDRLRLGGLIAGLQCGIPSGSRLAQLASSCSSGAAHVPPPSLEDFLDAARALDPDESTGASELGEYLRHRFAASCDREIDEVSFLSTLMPETWLLSASARFHPWRSPRS